MIRIREWAVLEMPTGERRLIGVNKATHQPVISAPLSSFAPEDRQVGDTELESYELTDIGLVSVPVRRAWRQWCRDQGEPGFVEVTEQYEAAITAAAEFASICHARSPDDGIDLDAYRRDELRRRHQLVANGELVRGSVISAFLGGPQELLFALSRWRVFWLEVDGERFFPAFLLDPELDLGQLAKVMRKLKTVEPWATYAFLTTPRSSIGDVTPIEALKRRMFTQVKECAEGFAQG